MGKMQDEMSDEWFELATKNIHKLIPQEWMPQINEILPKILKIVKIGMKKNIKTTAEQLGNDRIFLMMNSPYIIEDGSTIMVPSCFSISKDQLGPSVLDESTGRYELMLKPGEKPQYTFSMLTFIEKMDKYDKLEDLIRDLKNGTFMTLEDIQYNDGSQSIDAGQEQKQLPSGE